MNASVSTFNLAGQMEAQAPDTFNRVPVKVDASGVVWMEGKPLVCPPAFPCSSRGELVFTPGNTGLLLGPWGPDPDSHIILSARFYGQDEGRLKVMLDGGLVLQTCLPGNARMLPRPRQRVWLSISLTELEYCH